MKFEKSKWNKTSYNIVIIKNWTWKFLGKYLRFAGVDLYKIRCSGYALFKLTFVARSIETDVLAFELQPLHVHA